MPVTAPRTPAPATPRRARRPLALALAAVAAAAGLAAAPAGPAAAAPAGGYVAFGDSFPANPGPGDEVPGAGGCPQGRGNVGRLLAGTLGLRLHDHTCNGSTAFMPGQPQKTLRGQIEAATAAGHLNGATRLVTVFIGANDAAQAGWAPAPAQDAAFHEAVVAALRDIRARTPRAQVKLVGYPELTSRDDRHFACPVNVAGVAPEVPAAPVHVAEAQLQHRQAAAAAAAGAHFVDMKDVAHVRAGMCAPDGERLVSAVLDSDVAQYNMTNHLTHRGSRVFADVIAVRYHRGN